MFVLIWIPLLVGGMALVVFGLRGRIVGTEPRCVGCGYDLSGGDGVRLSGVRELGHSGAVRIGRQMRRRATIGLGVALCLPGVAYLTSHVGA